MNTILLQKILDILTEGLAHVGNFFKDLFVSDPQDGQVIGYDADAGKWKNVTLSELAIDLTDTAGPDDIISFSDAADMPLNSLVANINIEGGIDKVVVTRVGVNLFDKTSITDNVYLSTTTGLVEENTNYCVTDFIPVKAGVSYYIPVSYSIRRWFYDLSKTPKTYVNTIPPFVYTPTEDGYIRVTLGKAAGQAVDLDTWQINMGSTALPYEPYNGIIETITLPASVANGYVDIISGAGMNTDTSTPFTVTPVKIKSTTGLNNIFADTGDVSAVYYTKTAGDIKSIVCITEDITSEVTKNTTDFSDILLKVSQNNKVVSVEIYSATTAAAVNDTFLSNLP